MKLNKKIFLIPIALISVGISTVYAKEFSKDNISYKNFDNFKKTLCKSSYKYGDITFRDSKTVNGHEIYYYCEFAEPSTALDNVKRTYKDAVDKVKEDNNLPELTDESYKAYYEAVQNYPLSEEKIYKLNIFLDTYSNTMKNNEIDEVIDSLTNKSETNSKKSELLEELNMMLPTYNDNITNDYAISTYAAQHFNIKNGVAYAEKYAWSANTNQYHYIGEWKDCTNFVSQILEQGGYNQVGGFSKYSGWWYNKAKLTYSHSWSSAQNFMKYWGHSSLYRNFYLFSKDIRVGDIIAADYNDDGGFNHMGFVTYKANSEGTHTINYNGSTTTQVYYDFIVAQHSKEYNSWVSEDVNGWENGVLDNWSYAYFRPSN